jgi:hypothetical protein
MIMARRGRPVLGAKLAQGTDGSNLAQRRLEVLLSTLAGTMTIDRACRELGIGRSRFHALRGQFLQQAAGWLEPRSRGRRAHVPDEREVRLGQLQQQIARLKLDLYAAQVREELALVMPHVLKAPTSAPASAGEKNSRRARRRTRRRAGSTSPATSGGGSRGSRA